MFIRFALARFASAKSVFFVLEGCIKADAVLTAGGAVFSVPSVTLWDCAELPRFAEHYLRDKTIVIVPDADWAKNPLVFTQARLCQTRLRRLGISAHVAAPPAGAGLKGVDDFLAAGGKLEDLEVLDRQPGRFAFYFKRNDERARNAEVLVSLVMHADPDGILCVPLRAIARIMGVHVERVARAIRALESQKSIRVEGDLTINKKGWIAHNFYSNELDWEERPTIVIPKRNRAMLAALFGHRRAQDRVAFGHLAGDLALPHRLQFRVTGVQWRKVLGVVARVVGAHQLPLSHYELCVAVARKAKHELGAVLCLFLHGFNLLGREKTGE